MQNKGISKIYSKPYIIIYSFMWGFMIIRTIYGVIHKGLAAEPVFWIAAVIEVAFGLLSYKLFLRSITEKNYEHSVVLSWVLVVAAISIPIALPIALSYTVDSMEPARGTWWIYFMTGYSWFLYIIIKKKAIFSEVK
ncbi:hypothetical protein ACFLW2_04870 [Chloroflexota bacterium]